jgi:hypothetical protein
VSKEEKCLISPCPKCGGVMIVGEDYAKCKTCPFESHAEVPEFGGRGDVPRDECGHPLNETLTGEEEADLDSYWESVE